MTTTANHTKGDDNKQKNGGNDDSGGTKSQNQGERGDNNNEDEKEGSHLGGKPAVKELGVFTKPTQKKDFSFRDANSFEIPGANDPLVKFRALQDEHFGELQRYIQKCQNLLPAAVQNQSLTHQATADKQPTRVCNLPTEATGQARLLQCPIRHPTHSSSLSGQGVASLHLSFPSRSGLVDGKQTWFVAVGTTVGWLWTDVGFLVGVLDGFEVCLERRALTKLV